VCLQDLLLYGLVQLFAAGELDRDALHCDNKKQYFF
jgi:hypothetical protein